MNPISKNISEFLNDNKIATVCFVDNEGKPYCINCFYVYDEKSLLLIFKSSVGTTHHNFIKPDTHVAGTILPGTIDFLKIKGIQFNGKLVDEKHIGNLELSSKYTKKFPISLAIPGYVWGVKLNYIKFTDNTLGFGNKNIWEAAGEK